MSDVLCRMIPFLFFPLAASLTLNPMNYDVSLLNPRSLLANAPYLSRDTNSSAVNNITSNITSGSEKFIWIIEDIYNTSNFFQWVPQFVAPTPIFNGPPSSDPFPSSLERTQLSMYFSHLPFPS
jgi:hypothetical protein